jgi:hypothetical protein
MYLARSLFVIEEFSELTPKFLRESIDLWYPEKRLAGDIFLSESL